MQHFPAGRQLGLHRCHTTLEINPGIVGKHMALRNQSTQLFEHIGSEGRVEKHDIERLDGYLAQILECVRLAYRRAFCAQLFDIAFQCSDGKRGFFHEHGRGRAARQSLKSQRAGAREEIQAPGAFDARCQPVKQRFPNALRCRPKARHIGDIEQTAAPVSRYNTQPSWRRLFVSSGAPSCHYSFTIE